jgi:site-specific DNA recombinase
MKYVYAYIRVSTIKQGEHGSSLEEQRFAIENYAQRHNLCIRQWFEEKETAAKRGRTVFTKMLGLLVKGKAEGVIIHKIDRSARNLKDWADLGSLIDKGIEVHFAHESLDLQSRGGRLAADIQAVVAADFIRNLRDEVKKGFRGRLRQGLYPLRAPLGYQDQGRGLPKLPDPIMAPLVQKAFQLYATGQYNLYTLGEEMHQAGLRNRRGNRVTRNGLSTMLNNEFYIGIMHITSTGERYPGIHEPLIKKEQFDKVQNILRGRTKNTGLKHEFRYRKTIKCLHCHYNLIAERQKGNVYYRCQTKDCPRACIREDRIDKQMQDMIDRLSIPQAAINLLEAEFVTLQTERYQHQDELIKSAELNLANIDERINRLTDAYIDRMIDKETFDDKNKRLLHERLSAREALEELQATLTDNDNKTKKFLELVKAISINKNKANEVENRDLLKSVTSNLEIDGKRLVFTLQKPFAAIANNDKLRYGEPYRYRSRTLKKVSRVESKEIFKLIHDKRSSGNDLGKQAA